MSENKKEILINFKKAKSLMDKLISMTDDGEYCIDIMQQNLAAIGLLKSANMALLEGHVDHCVKNACTSGNKKDIEEKMEELIRVLKIAQSK